MSDDQGARYDRQRSKPATGFPYGPLARGAGKEAGADRLPEPTFRYFFDIDDAGRQIRGTVGIDLGAKDVAMEAKYLLHLLVFEYLPAGRPRTIVASVRNAADRVIYRDKIHLV